MPPRYIVRMVHDAQLYSVWDNEKKRLAIFEDRECADLNFDDAFKMATTSTRRRTPEREVGSSLTIWPSKGTNFLRLPNGGVPLS
jgi:hypothetical protein